MVNVFKGKIWIGVFLIFISTTVIASSPSGQMPSMEEMWSLIQKQQTLLQEQQAAINNLERKLEDSENILKDTETSVKNNSALLAETNTLVDETRVNLDMTADAVDSLYVSNTPLVDLFGYGELHYNNLDSGSEMDFHRFVLFVGYRFSDTVRLFSELEVEHSIAGDGKVGEVEIEQAFLRWDYAENHHSKGGLFLMPVGILNETHEPNTFYGVERNDVEKNIIPSTWWEGGFMLGGELAPGWSYDFAIHSGLNLDTDNSNAGKRTSVRSARQKVGKAAAENLAYTGRVRYTGIPGLSWGLSVQYQDDVTQSDDDGIGISDIDGVLLETNIVYENAKFELRGLFGQWSFDDKINLLNDGADEQTGWYLEPSYRLSEKLGIFARYSVYDLTAGANRNSEKNQINVGLNYWFNPEVVFKFDVQRQDNDNGNDNDGFHLGIGYSF
jgi:hypothetical protein